MPNFFTEDETGNPQYPSTSEVPTYLLAADNHNLGNTRGGSWLEPETWGEKFANGGKMIATGMLSGANSFYNSGVAVSNWFGAEAETNDTREWISSIDSDLGSYYEQNQEGADLVGFIAGSLLPGLGGIKVLNAGQTALKAASRTGLLGENLSRATGLLIPQTERYIATAARDIANSQATFSAINQAGIKALASGVWQNTLEGIAFETAVQATMFKSPILEKQDGWDIAKNIAIGGAFQGIIGGAFSAASSLGKIKRAVAGIEREVKPFSARTLTEEGTSPAERIILFTEDKADAIKKFEAYGADSPLGENFESIATAHTDKLRRIDNDIRSAFHELVGKGNTELGNMLADAHVGLDPDTALKNLLGADEITSLSKVSKLEAAATKAVKDGKPIDDTVSQSFLKLTGEEAGTVFSDEPVIKNLADTLGASGGLKSAVLSAVKERGFRSGQNWSVLSMTGKNSHLDAEARYIWADQVMKEIKPGTAINQYDLPVLERALKDRTLSIKLVDDKGSVLKDGFSSVKELQDQIIALKKEATEQLLLKTVYKGKVETEFGTEAISKITNVKHGWTEGTTLTIPEKDMFAWQKANEDYLQMLNSRGLRTPANADADVRFLPTYAKISRKAPELTDIDGHVIDGMTYIKQQQKVQQLAINNVVAKHTGEFYEKIPEITDSQLLNANRYGAGAGVASFANGGYGTLESIAQYLGTLTNGLKKAFRGKTEIAMEGKLFNLMSDQEAAIEFSTVNQKVTRSAEQWKRISTVDGEPIVVSDPIHYSDSDQAWEHFLVSNSLIKQFTKEGETDWHALLAEAEEEKNLLRLNKLQTVELIDTHISRIGDRTLALKELRAAQGMENAKDTQVFRPIRANPKDYPYFAFVKDPSVTGQGHTTMIWAANEGKLAELVGKVPAKFQVITKRDTEEFFQARNEYEYSRTLHENYINPELKNSGVMSDFFTKTDPQKIVNDILQQHLREDDMLAVELMRAKNQKAFDWLEDQGNAYTKFQASKLGSYSNRLETSGKNPYLDYIKTALDISKMGEHPWISGFNKLLDGAVSRAVSNISETWDAWRNPLDQDAVGKINSLLDKYGMNTGFRDAATDLLVNHTAPKGELTKFVRGANAILSKLTLGLDPLNAVNNFIGANILRGTELKQITDAIASGNRDLAGELGKLTQINLPNGVGAITSPTKLVAQAMRNFIKDDGTLLTRYKEAGYIRDISEQFKSILDDFTLKGTETVGELNRRLTGAFQKAKSISEAGEKYSGNKFAEELNRFVSADVMRQITDLGVAHGVLSPQEQLAYINTFVNRVEGNIIASQRPLMFQGPIGQAVGLFQSYQFNLMQQMFRYTAEGSAKDAAMLLGLQGTFYGMQGLPAFQFINQHVVGTMSGNQKHVDLYDSLYGVAGKDLGDLLTYGIPTNLLRANIYSRGDINPRQVTVIPTNVADVPIVGAFTKFLGSVQGSVSKIANGGAVWESMLQGLEHNGLSRPLAGLAQTLQAFGNGGTVYSTTNKGSILSSNDLFSWATAVRLAGGRPIDEAIVNDGVYRIQAYQQMDRAKMMNLAGAVKASSIQGNIPDETSTIRFAQKYAEYGGKQTGFNKFMMQEFKAANQSQAEKIFSQLQNPFAQKMQVLMGGGTDGSLVTQP